jgi:hypothetical protein
VHRRCSASTVLVSFLLQLSQHLAAIGGPAAVVQGLERDPGATGAKRARLLQRRVRVHLAPAGMRPGLQRRHGLPEALPRGGTVVARGAAPDSTA